MVATNEEGQVSVDNILERLGITGRYQVLQAAWQFLSNLSIAFQLLNVVFIAQDVQHWCEKSPVVVSDGVSSDLDSNDTIYGNCEVTSLNTTLNTTTKETCQSWEYSEGKHHSIVSEWDLVCDNAALGRLPQSLFVAGQGVGALLFSILSDKLGRRPFLLICQICTCGLGFGLAFSPNIETFMVLRMLNGAFQQGVVVTLSTMILEIFPRNRRVEVATVSAIVWGACPCLLALVAFLLRRETWGTLQLVFSAMSLVVILQLIFMDESLRWLVTNKKDERVETILKKASKMNKVDVSSVMSLYNSGRGHNLEIPSKGPDPKQETEKTSAAANYTFFDIFRSKFMLKISLIVWVTWMVDSLTYFSLYLTASSLADDLYLNFFLNSVAELPTGPLFWILSRRIGRRMFFMLFHVISGACLLTATALRNLTVDNAASVVATVFAFIGKVGSATCFTSLFVYVPEIYPTNLRTAGLGAGSTAARIGAAMAPFTQMLVRAIPWLPGTIFGVACLFVAALGILLPEPEGRELPETIEDIKSWDNSIPPRNRK